MPREQAQRISIQKYANKYLSSEQKALLGLLAKASSKVSTESIQNLEKKEEKPREIEGERENTQLEKLLEARKYAE